MASDDKATNQPTASIMPAVPQHMSAILRRSLAVYLALVSMVAIVIMIGLWPEPTDSLTCCPSAADAEDSAPPTWSSTVNLPWFDGGDISREGRLLVLVFLPGFSVGFSTRSGHCLLLPVVEFSPRAGRCGT